VNVGEVIGDPVWIAVDPTGTKVYVVNQFSNTVSVIDTATDTVTATVSVESLPEGVAVNPTGTRVYVANRNNNTVSVIDTASNTVIGAVSVGSYPVGVAVTPDGNKVYVTNFASNNVSVINTETNTVMDTVNVGAGPSALGQFIGSVSVPTPVRPIANLSANPTSGKVPLNVKFTDISTGIPTKWKWTFGDGTSSTQQNPVHKYSQTGDYTVALMVSNAKGSNTITKTGYIQVTAKPVAAFSASPTSGKAPLNVKFTETSTGSSTSWKWDFGDGTTSTKQNLTHKYSKAGNYTVALTVSNTAGSNTVTKTGYIQVTEKPAAAFSASPTSGKAPLNVAFTDISTGIPTKWKWDFGDGTTSTKQNLTHKYSKAGNYTVALTVSNTAGSNTVTKTDYIIVK
jgi:YVTN family beta-propeller protein